MPPKAARGRKKAAVGKVKSIDIPSKEIDSNGHVEVKTSEEMENSSTHDFNEAKSVDDNVLNEKHSKLANGKPIPEDNSNELEIKTKSSKRGRPKKVVEKASAENPNDPKQEPNSAISEFDKNCASNGDVSRENMKMKTSNDSSNDLKEEVPSEKLQETNTHDEGIFEGNKKTSENNLDDPDIDANNEKAKTEIVSPDDKNKQEAKAVPLKRGRPKKVVKALEESPDGPKLETKDLSSESPEPNIPNKDVPKNNDKTVPDISDDKKNDGNKDVPLRRGRPRKAAKTSEEDLDQSLVDDNNSKKVPSKRGRPKKNDVKKSEDSFDEQHQDEIKIPTKNNNLESEELSSVSNKRQNETSDNEVKKEAKVLKVNLQRSESIDKMLEEQTKVIEKGGANTTKAGSKRKGGDADSQDGEKSAKVSKKETKSKGQSKKDKMPDVTLLDFSNKSTSPTGQPWNLKISSWNVNGVRAWLEKDGLAYVTHEDPDIMVFQETKCSDKTLPSEVNVEGYHAYWLAGDKDGYSGVGLISKMEPISVKYGIGVEEHDNEGRVITAEYETFYLVTTYVPNSGRALIRLDYRMQWDKDFLSYLKNLDEKKPVVLCGDLNVAHEEIDLANPKNNKRNAGFTKEEREAFSTLLSEGFVDSFRHLYPDVKGAYTFWTYMMNARAKNVGWRLDYFVLSEKLTDNLCDSVIRKDVFGSDHCPITLFLNV